MATCRLGTIKLDEADIFKYLLTSIHNREIIDREIYLNHKDPEQYKKLPKYDLPKIVIDRNLRLNKKLILEIACGTGDFLTSYAEKYPDLFFIGVDYALPVIQRAVKKASQKKLQNIIFYNGRMEDFLEYDFSNLCFNTIYVNFPDPWPKKKHIKKRIIRIETLKLLIDALYVDGELCLATDLEYLYNYHEDILLNYKSELSLIDTGIINPPVEIYNELSVYQKKGLAANREIFFSHYKKNIRKNLVY